ncbi:MAG TPA: pilus assembly protein TadG-related protein, partial [Myxococcaceae bacterium]
MTRPPPRHAERGQAAALMAVTMALIGLMVCLTLGIGMKVKEKAEAQTLADVSAYSGAVATARTFNSIAILNRVEIAQMVSAIATQSLVSYGGYYRAMVWSSREQFEAAKTAIGGCPDTCGWCARYDALIAGADAEIIRINTDWARYDGDGNRRVDRVRGGNGAGGVHGAAQSLYTSLMNDQIVGLSVSPPLAAAIVQRVDNVSAFQGEMTAPNTVNVVNQRELGIAPNCLATEDLICD